MLDNLQPLCEKETQDTRRFVRLEWAQVEQYIGDPDKVFAGVDGKNEDEVSKLAVLGHAGKTVGDLSHDEKRNYFLNKVRHSEGVLCVTCRDAHRLARQPAVVFLGVDERSAPESSKSLPLSKPTETSTLEQHSPYGTPYWALDVSKLTDLKKTLLAEKEGREFVELRAGSQVIPNDEASIGAEARSLVDWNTRNKVCLSSIRNLSSSFLTIRM